jgi:Glycosyltransferase family 87
VTDVLRSPSALPRAEFARELLTRLREPRRLAAILLLALAGGLILAFVTARGDLAGSDAYAYWTAVQRWFVGADIYQAPPGNYVPPTQGALPYSYAPWTLYLLLPWAVLPWNVAWIVWRGAMVIAFAATVVWAYRQRPLFTAVLVALFGVPLAANFDTGNVNLFIGVGLWVAYWAGPRGGGLAWAIPAAIKFLPIPLLPFMPRRSWKWGLVIFGVLIILTLATWPETVRQLDIDLYYPRPLRVDYLVILWGLVPWLYSRPWPPRLSWSWLREAPPPSA